VHELRPRSKRLPHGFRRGTDGAVACPHRDLSCCPDCYRAHPDHLVDVAGAAFWYGLPEDADAMRRMIAAPEGPR
jgi:hypothetical protein